VEMKNIVLNGSKRVLTVLATFTLLLGGFLGAAAAAPIDQPGPAPVSTAVGERTEHASPDKTRTAGTLAAISHRHLWCGISGEHILNLTGLGAFDGQPVAVTVSEAGTGGSEFIASARMRVNNVSVWAGTVSVWVSVEWGSPLCIWTHYVAI
jgi:hypothetical protein